jgi:hypothetical protein
MQSLILKIIGCLLFLTVGLGIWLFGFQGYMPWTHRVTRQAPQLLGTRLNAQGVIVQKIWRQTSTSSAGALMTPEGPRNRVQYKTEYFVQSTTNLMVRLPFFSDADFNYVEHKSKDVRSELLFCDKFLPVTNSPLWIAAGADPAINFTGGNDYHVVVFDGRHLINTRTFSMRADLKHPGDQFQFTDGNRTLKLNTSLGYAQIFDVLTNRITSLK